MGQGKITGVLTAVWLSGAALAAEAEAIPNGEEAETESLVERLMGRKPELRFQYIQEHARFVEELDV